MVSADVLRVPKVLLTKTRTDLSHLRNPPYST